MTNDQIMGLIRHVATFLGGILAARGYLGGGLVESFAAAVATLGGMFWSYVSKPAK